MTRDPPFGADTPEWAIYWALLRDASVMPRLRLDRPEFAQAVAVRAVEALRRSNWQIERGPPGPQITDIFDFG